MMRIVSVDHIRGGSSNLGKVVGTAEAAATAMVAISEELHVLLLLCDEAVVRKQTIYLVLSSREKIRLLALLTSRFNALCVRGHSELTLN